MAIKHTTFYHQAKYLTSVAAINQLPADIGCEVAFIGRSNSGKSSALNAITDINGLARVSKTPGRTQMINFFLLNAQCRLVDLPGYGYVKVPRVFQENWEKNVEHYLKYRVCLKGLVLVMDVRHPLKVMDEAILQWTVASHRPTHILLTKSDKLTRQAAKNTLHKLRNNLNHRDWGDFVSVQLFSAHEKTGVDEVQAVLDQWYAQ